MQIIGLGTAENRSKAPGALLEEAVVGGSSIRAVDRAGAEQADVRVHLPPATAEDDLGYSYDEKSVFSRKLFHHFSQPPYSECVKLNEISKILHTFWKKY